MLATVNDAWDNGCLGAFFKKELVCARKLTNLREVEQWRTITLLTSWWQRYSLSELDHSWMHRFFLASMHYFRLKGKTQYHHYSVE